MSFVEVRNADHSSKKHIDFINDALKELKRQMKKEGILQDLKRHEAYITPSKRRRIKKNEAFKRRKRDERKEAWFKKKPATNSPES